MIQKIVGLSLMLLIGSIIGCKEFIEKSVEERKVVLLAPAENLESNKYNINFWWEPVEDALSYRVQIVSPKFDSIGYLVADTLIKTDKFNLVLEPGKYEWRVRAENGSSKSLYTSRSFIIYVSSIQDQQIQLKSPGNGTFLTTKDVIYKWEALYGSAQYRLQLDTNNFSNDTILVYDNTTSKTEVSVPFSKERTYQWRVRGEMDSTYSKWSAINSVTYDATAPGKVTLNSPANNLSLSKPINLQWGSVSTAIKYQLVVMKSDSTTVYNSTFPLTLTATSYSFNEGSMNEKIYWKVRAIDAAGNIGTYSDVRNFTVQ